MTLTMSGINKGELTMTNKERVIKIKKLLGLQGEDENEYYRVADVLCDLKHFCDANNINFNEEAFMSEEFYISEKESQQ